MIKQYLLILNLGSLRLGSVKKNGDIHAIANKYLDTEQFNFLITCM